MKLTLVAAVVLIRDDGFLLLAQRPPDKPLAGLWEFPGGKIIDGETPEQALVRELKEELGITVDVRDLAPLTFASHSYPETHLLMPLYTCRRWVGETQALEGQSLRWVSKDELDSFAMPPADIPLIPIVQSLL